MDKMKKYKIVYKSEFTYTAEEFKKLNKDLWFCEKLFFVIGPKARAKTGFNGQRFINIFSDAQE